MLQRIRKAMEERDKGFTMVEILVVVVIIGILAAISIPKFLTQKHKAVDSGLQTDLANAALSVETWISDHPQSNVPKVTETHPADGVFTPPTAGSDAANVLNGFTPSNGNTIVVAPFDASANAGTNGNIGKYVICDYNDNASTATSTAAFYLYSSDNGGLQSNVITASSAVTGSLAAACA